MQAIPSDDFVSTLPQAPQLGHEVVQIEPVSFDGHMGAFHRPAAQDARGATVLICPPIGREARSAYRPLFLWAQQLAACGFQVLRYDHRGEGDSLPLPRDADQWAWWRNGVVMAAEFARTYGGTRELVVAGVRIGGALAMLASEELRPDGLILLAPVPTGAGWIRDLRLGAAIQNAPQPIDGGFEADGLRLSPATIASLEDADARSVVPTWRSAFLAAPGGGGRLAKTLGPQVTLAPFEGYGRLFAEPHSNEAPQAVFDAATGWLQAFTAQTPAARPARPVPSAQFTTAAWIERPVSFGEGLRGVLCLPRRPTSERRAVIFGNTGGDPRAGVGNFAARACRTLATSGVAALRFDFRGVGESAPAPEGPMHVYETSRFDDYRQAAELLAAHGFDEPILAGVCTGGHHAVRAVVEGAGFRRAIAINAWLVWRPGRPLEAPADGPRAAAGAPAPRWRRVLRDGRDLASGLGGYAQRVIALWRPDPLARRVRARIRRACRGEVAIHLILGRGDRATRDLEREFGFGCLWLRAQRGISVKSMRNLDHALFSDGSQQQAIDEICRHLGLPPAMSNSAGAAEARPRRQEVRVVGAA